MSKKLLRLIVKELRDLAKVAYGNPPTVQISALTLREYADAIEAAAEAPDENA